MSKIEFRQATVTFSGDTGQGQVKPVTAMKDIPVITNQKQLIFHPWQDSIERFALVHISK